MVGESADVAGAFTCLTGAWSGERDVRNFALLFRLDIQEACQFEAECAGDDVVGEILGFVVVGENRIVKGLARECHLVFGTRQFLLQLHHVLIRLQIRISFREGKKTSERAAKEALGRTEFLYRIGVGRVRFGSLEIRYGSITGTDDGVECFAFMLHVAFDGFDEIRDQVVTPGQLDIDLRESVFDAIAKIDQTIVDANCIKDYRGNYREENYE